jgi:titin
MTITNYKIYRDGTLHDTVGVVSTYSDSLNTVSGTTYGYTVSAVGQTIGEGSQSSSISLVVGLPPDAPTGLSTSINNPNTTPLDITVNWSAPAYTGTTTISNYEVYRDGTLVATVGNVLTHTDTVPTGGGTFVYSLKAVTAHGTSVLSATVTQTTATVPPTPTVSPTLTIVSPDATPLDITASWVAQATGGSNITGYEVFRSTDNVTFTSVGTTTTLSLTDTVPSAGLYYYKFTSINLIGNSSQSASNNTATPTVPDASSVTAFIANPNPSPFDVTVSFVAPSSNGGSAVTGYNLYLSPDDITYTQVATNVTSTQVVTVSGVGTHYFKSEAINLIGTGALGTAVTVATPNTPDAPSLTLAIPDPNNFPFDTTATFIPPTNNGGSLVTGYNLYYSSDDITYTSIATATSSVISHTVGSAGTHYFKAESISNAGTGVLSSAFTIATPTVPNAPSITLTIPDPNNFPFDTSTTFIPPTNIVGSIVT